MADELAELVDWQRAEIERLGYQIQVLRDTVERYETVIRNISRGQDARMTLAAQGFVSPMAGL